ncbi:MAG TPA: hypothetical protein VFU27_01555 [Terriglobales bacterium]|nr:hypothetical protein [Terriglobales bacterium]
MQVGGTTQGANFAVTLDKEPGHHLVLQNQYTRVFQVEVPPHASTELHLHQHNYLFVSIGPALIENQVQGKASVKMKLQDGQTELAKGPFAHVIKNLADAPFRNVTIEILRPGAPQTAPPERGLDLDSDMAVQILYDTPQVRVSEFQLNPGMQVEAGARKWPHLLVAVSEMTLRDQVRNGRGIELKQKPGDISWSAGGHAHTFTNTGQKAAHWVEVEFK